MVDYEKGTPGWDIGQMITRHDVLCAKREDLRRTVTLILSGMERADSANMTECTCGRGPCSSETTRRRNGGSAA